jgi:hypothetical protein
MLGFDPFLRRVSRTMKKEASCREKRLTARQCRERSCLSLSKASKFLESRFRLPCIRYVKQVAWACSNCKLIASFDV